MAKQTVTKLLDDLDGGAAHETVTFGLDGHTYEIDLSSKNAKKLRTELATYVERGSRLRARQPVAAGRARSRASATPAVADKEQNRAIRAWAHSKGYDIAPRGRIKQEIVAEFHRTAGR